MTQTGPSPAPRLSRDALLIAGLIGLVLIGIVGLGAATGWEETLAQIKRLSAVEIAALLALSLLNYGARGLRWHLFTRRLGLGLPLSASFRHFFGGFAMSVTPGRLGELVRMRWIKRETGTPFEKSAPLMLVDRAFDLAAMGILLALALSLSATGIKGGLPVAALALALSYLATRPALLAKAATWGHRATGRFARLFARIRRAARALAAFSGARLLTSATLLGLLGWGAEGYAFYLLLDVMGADIALPTAIAIFLFATLAGGLTGAPGGLGGAEAAMIALLALEGVGLATALPATLIIRVTTLWFAIGIGIFAFPIAEKHSKRGSYVENN